MNAPVAARRPRTTNDRWREVAFSLDLCALQGVVAERFYDFEEEALRLAALEQAWEESRTEERRQVVIEAAEAELDRFKAMQRRADLEGQRESPIWERAIAFDPRPVREVADDYQVSSKRISELRKACGLPPRVPGRPRASAVPLPTCARSVREIC